VNAFNVEFKEISTESSTKQLTNHNPGEKTSNICNANKLLIKICETTRTGNDIKFAEC